MTAKYTNIAAGKIIYPELSYKIVGSAFEVFNGLGYGLNEKYYQRAFEKALEQRRIPFKKEQQIKLYYGGQPIGSYFLDFVIENKIIVELKVRPKLGYVNVRQVMSYLKTAGYKLAILIYFTREGIKYRRIINTI